MSMQHDRTRRHVLAGLAGLLAASSTLARQLAPTPAQMAGPFYPLQPPLEDDSDLTRVKGGSVVAKGRIADLSGRLVDAGGRPLRNMRVEIWQCDANGRYHHPHDRGPAPDANFQGFGFARTDDQGRYRFRTIRPVPYPGRTPHIHFAVHAPGQPAFTTQLYVADEPRNQSDFLFLGLSAEQRARVVADFVPLKNGEAELAARFDIVLAGGNGTPGM
jgi:protocatechuate 3,4-dioxygenase, beta subunit